MLRFNVQLYIYSYLYLVPLFKECLAFCVFRWWQTKSLLLGNTMHVGFQIEFHKLFFLPTSQKKKRRSREQPTDMLVNLNAVEKNKNHLRGIYIFWHVLMHNRLLFDGLTVLTCRCQRATATDSRRKIPRRSFCAVVRNITFWLTAQASVKLWNGFVSVIVYRKGSKVNEEQQRQLWLLKSRIFLQAKTTLVNSYQWCCRHR